MNLKINLFCILAFVISFSPLRAQDVEPENPFTIICECQNSKGLSMDEYVNQESKKLNLSKDDFVKDFSSLMNDRENWFFKEFISDPVFMNNLKDSAVKMQERTLNQNTEKQNLDEGKSEELLKDLERNYPVCWSILPVFVSMIGN